MIRFFLGMALGAVLLAFGLWLVPDRAPWEHAIILVVVAQVCAGFVWDRSRKAVEPQVHLHDAPACTVTETRSTKGKKRFDIVFDPPLGAPGTLRTSRPLGSQFAATPAVRRR